MLSWSVRLPSLIRVWSVMPVMSTFSYRCVSVRRASPCPEISFCCSWNSLKKLLRSLEFLLFFLADVWALFSSSSATSSSLRLLPAPELTLLFVKFSFYLTPLNLFVTLNSFEPEFLSNGASPELLSFYVLFTIDYFLLRGDSKKISSELSKFSFWLLFVSKITSRPSSLGVSTIS